MKPKKKTRDFFLSG